jgi:hypothetical protein
LNGEFDVGGLAGVVGVVLDPAVLEPEPVELPNALGELDPMLEDDDAVATPPPRMFDFAYSISIFGS